MSALVEYLKNIEPKTEEEIIDEIKNLAESDFNLKEFNSKLKNILQPFDYKKISEDILKQFNIVYSPADVKKLISLASLIPDSEETAKSEQIPLQLSKRSDQRSDKRSGQRSKKILRNEQESDEQTEINF